MARGQHVLPTDGRWAVRKAGAAKASRVYRTRSEAIAAGKRLARKQGTELYVHGPDGKIRSRNSYGSDPHPPKG